MEVLGAVTKRAIRERIPADVRKALRRFCMLSLVEYCRKHGPNCNLESYARNKCALCWCMMEVLRTKMNARNWTCIAQIWSHGFMKTNDWTVIL